MPTMAKQMSSDTKSSKHNSNRTQNGMEVISNRDTASGAIEGNDSRLDIIARKQRPGGAYGNWRPENRILKRDLGF